MEIIDAHVHLFPTQEAGQKALRDSSPTGYWGTWSELVEVMEAAGVSKAAAVATLPLKFMFEAAIKRQNATDSKAIHQQVMEKMVNRLHRYNTWLREHCSSSGRLWAFIHADPFVGMDVLLRELEGQLRLGGVRGLKMHPMLGHYFPDDHSLWPLYEWATENDLIIIFHGGRSPESPNVQYSHPQRFVKVGREFPGLRMVVAHLGFDFWEDTRELASITDNVYLDTSVAISGSSQQPMLTDKRACELIRAIGTGRVLFGSDFPWGNPKDDLKRILNLGLTDSELEDILFANASMLFGT